MATITGRTGQRVYQEVVNHVVEHGRIRKPRGIATRDAGFTVIELDSPLNALPLGCGRTLNRNIAAAEAVQLIGGFSRPDLLTKAVPTFSRYAEDDGRFHGAYGTRIGTQLVSVVTKLRFDRDTRQAVITLWDAALDNENGKRDYPCTVGMQFEFEPNSDTLNMNVVMRSNDVWLGLPYDLFQFTQLQLTVARTLDAIPGRYRHTVWSMHIYESDVDAVSKLHPPTDFTDQPTGFGVAKSHSIGDAMIRARRVGSLIDNEDETTSERWYRDRFSSYMG